MAMADDDEILHWFPAWQEEQRRLRELAGEELPEGPFKLEPEPEPRTLQ